MAETDRRKHENSITMTSNNALSSIAKTLYQIYNKNLQVKLKNMAKFNTY